MLCVCKCEPLGAERGYKSPTYYGARRARHVAWSSPDSSCGLHVERARFPLPTIAAPLAAPVAGWCDDRRRPTYHRIADHRGPDIVTLACPWGRQVVPPCSRAAGNGATLEWQLLRRHQGHNHRRFLRNRHTHERQHRRLSNSRHFRKAAAVLVLLLLWWWVIFLVLFWKWGWVVFLFLLLQ